MRPSGELVGACTKSAQLNLSPCRAARGLLALGQAMMAPMSNDKIANRQSLSPDRGDTLDRRTDHAKTPLSERGASRQDYEPLERLSSRRFDDLF